MRNAHLGTLFAAGDFANVVIARPPADSDSYERVVLVFNGEDPEALSAARGAWADCKARGLEVTYWQADERGRWQRR